MNKDTKISFGAQDNGVSSFIKKIQSDTKVLFGEMSKEAKKQGDAQKDQLKIIEQQIKALEIQNKLEKEQNQIILDRKRSAGTLSDAGYAKGISQMKEDASVGMYKTTLLQQMLEELRSQNKGKKKSDDDESITSKVFKGTLYADLVKGVLNTISRASGAGNEFELLGNIPYAGPPLARHMTTREQYYGALGRLRGLGSNMASPGMTGFGLDRIEGSAMQEQLIKSVGMQVTKEFIKDTAAINRLFTIDQGTMSGFLGARRMGALTNPTDTVQFLIDGIDRSVLGDAIKNQTALMTVFGQTTGRVNETMAQQMISEFNTVGGPFSVRDPRSIGLISNIQGNLTNPSTPFAQALGYSVLRNRNPDSGVLDLMIQRQKGGPGLLSGLMGNISQMGLSEDLQVMMFAQSVGLSGNLDAARRLYRNRGAVGKGGVSAYSIDRDKLYEQAAANVPDIEKGSAAVTNAFISGAIDGLGELADRFGRLVGKSLTESINEAFGNWMGQKSNTSGMGVMDWLNMANPAGKTPQKNGD